MIPKQTILSVAAFLTTISSVLLIPQCTNCTTESTTPTIPNPAAVSAKWRETEEKIKTQIDSLLRQVLPQVVRSNGEANITSECQAAIIRIVFGLRQLKGWALKILDASGKPPSGMIEGTLTALGSYHECVGTTAYYNDQDGDETQEMFRGKYCTVLIHPPLLHDDEPTFPRNYNDALRIVAEAARKGEIFTSSIGEYSFLSRNNAMRLGICVPSKCTAHDIGQMATLALKSVELTANVRRCEVSEKKTIHLCQKVAIGIISCFILLMILGTATDICCKTRSKHQGSRRFYTLSKVLRAFSVYSNTKKLLDSKTTANTLSFLEGIRFWSMSWIVLGHTYFSGRNSQIFKSMLNGYDTIVNNIFATPILNMTLAVDTFFFISGLLMVLSHRQKMANTKGRLNTLLKSVVRRYFRLTPSLGIVMLLMLLLPLFGSGPFWHESTDRNFQNCQKRWWINLLYINNWIHFKYMCIPETWYLAANMQLYITCILFLVPLFRQPFVGIFGIATLGILGTCVTAVVTWFYNAPPGVIFLPNYNLLDTVLTKVYHKTFTHLGPFCTGMIIGYLIVKYKDISIKPIYQIFGWAVAITVNMSVLYGVFEWNRGSMPGTVISVVYASTHRTAWCFGLGWVVCMCATGNGGIVTSVLSWKAFVPLGKISYMVYLVHPLVLMYHLGSIQEVIYYSHYQLVYLFLGHFAISIMLSTLCYLAVELPFANLERLIFGKNKTAIDEANAVQSQFISKL